MVGLLLVYHVYVFSLMNKRKIAFPTNYLMEENNSCVALQCYRNRDERKTFQTTCMTLPELYVYTLRNQVLFDVDFTWN